MRAWKQVILCFVVAAGMAVVAGCATESASRSKPSGHSCPSCSE